MSLSPCPQGSWSGISAWGEFSYIYYSRMPRRTLGHPNRMPLTLNIIRLDSGDLGKNRELWSRGYFSPASNAARKLVA